MRYIMKLGQQIDNITQYRLNSSSYHYQLTFKFRRIYAEKDALSGLLLNYSDSCLSDIIRSHQDISFSVLYVGEIDEIERKIG